MFVKDTDKDHVVLMGARASRVENQDAIDACIFGMFPDPKEVKIMTMLPTFRLERPKRTWIIVVSYDLLL